MDVGLAVVAPLNGRKLSEVVGAQGILFNGGYTKKMYSFGFPAAAPYDGTRLVYCSGTTGKDFLLTKDHSLGCNMTGGSSGGPGSRTSTRPPAWAPGVGEQLRLQLPAEPDVRPYFGNEAKAAYDKAQTS